MPWYSNLHDIGLVNVEATVHLLLFFPTAFSPDNKYNCLRCALLCFVSQVCGTKQHFIIRLHNFEVLFSKLCACRTRL